RPAANGYTVPAFSVNKTVSVGLTTCESRKCLSPPTLSLGSSRLLNPYMKNGARLVGATAGPSLTMGQVKSVRVPGSGILPEAYIVSNEGSLASGGTVLYQASRFLP